MADDDVVQIKLVVVGDGAIGKTCLLHVYKKGEFPQQYNPTVFENETIEKTMNIDGEEKDISLDLWDTAGQEEFDRLRHLGYRDTDVFLVCFSVVEEASFSNLQARWVPELQHHAPDATIVLIGLKCDLRDDEKTIQKLKAEGKEPMTAEQIEAYRKDCGAAAYVETSALKEINVDKAFDTAITAFLKPSSGGGGKKESGGCCIIV